ncbi:MAG TPA: sulfatase-like hydrolase/transferase [Gemmataceae bacterium]|nr:sulfatase-like hydrolase/transferase [Gemmataceae bacterium]
MSQVTTDPRMWEMIPLGLAAKVRSLLRWAAASSAEAAAVGRARVEMLSLALAICTAIFAVKGFIAYRDLDNAAAPPQVYGDSVAASVARVAACCGEDFAVGLGCFVVAAGVLGCVGSSGGRAAVRVLAHLAAAFALCYMVINAQIFHGVRHFLTYALVQHAGGFRPDRSIYEYATSPFKLALALVPILTLASHLGGVCAFPRLWQRVTRVAWRPLPLAVAGLVFVGAGQAAQRLVVTDSADDYAHNPHLHFVRSLFGTVSFGDDGGGDPVAAGVPPAHYIPGHPGHHPGLLAARPTNVILITAESVNSRFLETYGCRMGTTPFLRRLDEEGRSLTFENFYATSNKTIASALPIFGATYNDPTKLATILDYRDYPTPAAANWLRARGYTTYFLGTGGHTTWEGYLNVKPAFVDKAFDVGLDTSHPFWQAAARPTALTEDDYLDAPMFADLRRALRALKGRKFAVWAWTYDAHAPYFDGPGPQSFPKEHFPRAVLGRPEKEADFERHLRAIWRLDQLIEGLCLELEELGLADDTLIVLTGDHGEAFGEHGFIGHGSSVYEEEVRVPCVLINPRLAPLGRRSGVLGNHVDLWPTITDVCGLPANPRWQGRSLVGEDSGQRQVYFHAYEAALGVRDGKYKYIWSFRDNRDLLFDIDSDPLEKQNLAADNPQLCAEEQRRVKAWANYQTRLTQDRVAADEK